MSKDRATAQALEWLNAQIEALRYFRNATYRDAGFKQWRQNTLTIIQRIWPEDASRSNRFRQVPFAPKSARADDRTARESYAKGVAEVTGLLKMYVLDIQHHGLEAAATPEPEPAIAPAKPEPQERVEYRPKSARSNLGASVRSPASAPASATRSGGVASTPTARPAGAATPRPAGAATPRPAAAPAAPRGGSVAPTPAARLRPVKGKKRLKEMLGLTALSHSAPAEEVSPEDSTVEPELKIERVGRQTGRAGEAKHVAKRDRLEESIAQAMEEDAPRPKARREAARTAPAATRTVTSPAAAPKPTAPQKPAVRVTVDPWQEMGARLAGLCEQMGPLGVPVPDHGLLRGTLLDLARHAVDHNLDAAMVRKAMPVLSLYPNLCRRALTILTPVLDPAA